MPDDDQVLVRVHASSVNPLEWYGVTGPYFRSRNLRGAARQGARSSVTAVCSTRNVDLARSLGADRVVDYTWEDFVKLREPHDWRGHDLPGRAARGRNGEVGIDRKYELGQAAEALAYLGEGHARAKVVITV